MLRLRPKFVSLPLLLVFIGAGVLVPTQPTQVHAGEVLVPAEWREAHPGPYAITVAVLVDEEWVARFGADAQKEAYAVLAAASRHFAPADIDLRPVRYETWESRDGVDPIEDVLDSLELSHRPDGADIVLGLTAGYVGQEGGAARPRRPYVVVKHHLYHLERDAYVLTHEIAHTLGLHHHSCPDGRCIMAEHEYDPDKHWCPEHLELLRANGGLFQYLQGANLQA